MSQESRGRTTVRWGWLTAATTVGCVLLVIATALGGSTARVAALSGILVNLGTGFLLAAALVWLEPRFTRQVITSTRRAAEAVIKTEVQAAEERAEEVIKTEVQAAEERLNTRIDEDLGLKGFKARRRREAARAAEEAGHEAEIKINAMSRGLTYQTITDAFTFANRLGAVSEGALIVPVGNDVVGRTMIFEWSYGIAYPYRSVVAFWGGYIGDDDDTAVVFPPELRVRIPDGPPDLVWPPAESTAAFGERLRTRLGDEHAEFISSKSWPVTLANLQRALSLAVRLATDTWPSRSPMIGFIEDDWILTKAGLESLEYRVLFPRDYFPTESIAPISNGRNGVGQ